MPKYEVQVRATYYDDLVVEADDIDEAYKVAIRDFKPIPDCLFSIDVYGLSPWGDDGDPNAVDMYRDTMRGI